MRSFNTIQDVYAEREAQRPNKLIYSLLTVMIGEFSRLPDRHNPTADEIYGVVNRMYNNAVELSPYKEESVIEAEYLKEFIKKQLTDAEIVEIIMQGKDDGLKNKGDFMRLFASQYKGQYDGRTVSMVVDQILKQ
jgi:hypothetical protein